MKLSSKARYGVSAMFDIAFHNQGRATRIKAIAERQGIPPRFLEQIFQDLKRAGMVTSKRGPKGGYALARAPEDIRLGDILSALEGPLQFCAEPSDGPTLKRGAISRAVAAETFADLGRQVQACFDGVTVADLCARATERANNKPPRRYVYSI